MDKSVNTNTDEVCIGFWEMCKCSACRLRDKELENATPEQKRAAMDELELHMRNRDNERIH